MTRSPIPSPRGTSPSTHPRGESASLTPQTDLGEAHSFKQVGGFALAAIAHIKPPTLVKQ